MYPMIIGVTGALRAGKTTVATLISKNYGYRHASNSDLLKKIAKKMNIDMTRENLGSLGDALFSVLGNDLLAQFRLNEIESERIVVDGIRYKEEVERYKRHGSFFLIGVQAPDEIRHKRAIIANDPIKYTDRLPGNFSDHHNNRSELEVPKVMEMANAVINNAEDKVSLFGSVSAIMERFA